MLYADLTSTVDGARTEQERREDLKGNPFLVYGPGIHNFLKINNQLVCLFLLISIIAAVQMLVFRSFKGTDGLEGYTMTSRWSFGNIGYPSNLCSKAPLMLTSASESSDESTSMVFSCQGHTEITKVLSSGVVGYSSSDDYVGLTEVFGTCFYDSETTYGGLADYPFM